jgi:hypothetical protein
MERERKTSWADKEDKDEEPTVHKSTHHRLLNSQPDLG